MLGDHIPPQRADAPPLLDALLRTATDGIMVIDAAGIILMANQASARMFGHSAQDLVGKPLTMLMPTPYREHHQQYVQRYQDTGEKRIIGIGREVRGLRADGTDFPLDLSVGEARYQDDQVFVGIVRDLSEQYTAQSRLDELQQELMHVTRLTAMGEMTSALAHELNQPHAAITNYLQATRRLAISGGPEACDRVVQLIDKSVAQARRAGDIIRHLRDFVQKGETRKEISDLNELVKESPQFALIGTERRNIQAEIYLTPHLTQTIMDRVQIGQVIINLVRNAADVLQDTGGTIRISTLIEDDGTVGFMICDSGPGLAKIIRDNLFTPFMTTKSNGMGIGLSICKTIIDAHDGQIWVDDPPADWELGGACFRFCLPSAEDVE